MERVRACGARKKGGKWMCRHVFGFRFFLYFFSSLGSILRFPLQQTPLGPTATGRPSCKWGGGHLLQICHSGGEAANLHTVRKEEREKCLAFWNACFCSALLLPNPLLLKETRGRTRTLSKAERKPRDDFKDCIMTGETVSDVSDRQSPLQ